MVNPLVDHPDYYLFLQVIGSFVFLNLIVAVILENFSTLGKTNPGLVSASDIELFTEVVSSIQ